MISLAVDILSPPFFSSNYNVLCFVNSSITSARKRIFHFSNPEARHVACLSFPHAAMFRLDGSYQSCHLPSKSKWTWVNWPCLVKAAVVHCCRWAQGLMKWRSSPLSASICYAVAINKIYFPSQLPQRRRWIRCTWKGIDSAILKGQTKWSCSCLTL